MFGSVIEFDMALEKDPETVRTWVYAPSKTQRINDKEGALFFVTEKGKQDIMLSVRVKEANTEFTLGERTEFSKKDTEEAVKHIAFGISQRVASDTPDKSETN